MYSELSNSLALDIMCFYTFLCMQERQRAPSPPISPLRGDGDDVAARNSGGDVLSLMEASKPMI
jgi:hypothetical protein